MTAPALEARDLTKCYGAGPLAEPVLRGVSLALHAGESAVLLGPSGSGKTTLLSILGCLLTPDSGELSVNGARVDLADPAARTELRRTRLGFVFQQAQLLPFLTIAENLTLVAENAGLPHAEACARARESLAHLGLTKHLTKRPGQLSGGQRQRVAIARALLHRPPVILADEPTAALDRENGRAVAELLVAQSRESRAGLLVVTHDIRLVTHFDRVLVMDAGRLTETTKESCVHHAL